MEHAVRIRLNRLFAWVFILSIGVLGVSIGAELVGIKPCFLCKLQRIPYVLLGVNALIGLVTCLKRGMAWVIGGCFLMGVLLGSVHFASQMGWSKLPCSRNTRVESMEDFKRTLENPGCGEVWKVLGIPVSLWNVGICLGGLTLLFRSTSKAP